MLLQIEVADYDEWKKLFDSDPGGRMGIATGHLISRGVDNPNEVFVRTEYASVDDARKVRQQLIEVHRPMTVRMFVIVRLTIECSS